jgi:hypothetical protein
LQVVTGAKSRLKRCSRADALNRLAQARSFVEVAALVLSADDEAANPGVAAALAVLAGIAASDAACCARLGLRAKGDSHDGAVAVLATVEPHGHEMAKDLERLLNRKDDSHYGVAFVARGNAERMVNWAIRLTALATSAVEA